MPSNTPETQALLPCLVEGCSSKPRVQWQGAVAYVECAICGDTGPLGWTEDEAVAGWNARHRISHSLPGDVGMQEPWPGCYADLQQRRVTTLAKLGLMLSVMASGEAAEVVGYDAADLYAEVLMALAIEDADDTDIALEEARDHPDSDIMAVQAKFEALASLSTPTAEPTPTPDRIGKDAVREALERVRAILEQGRDGQSKYRQARIVAALDEIARALSATPAQEGE